MPFDAWVAHQGRYKKFRLSLAFFGIALFLFVIITFRFPVGDIAVAMAMVGLMIDRRGIIFPRFLLLLGAFVGWCALGIATTSFPQVAQAATLELAKLWLIWFAALGSVRTRAQFRWLLILMTLFYATHPIRGAIFNRLFYAYGGDARAVWNATFGNPNDLAAITLLFLGVAAGLLVSERKGLVRWGALACCIVFPMVILLTQSRANFLGLGLFGAVALLAGRKGSKQKIRGLVFLGLIGIVALFTVPDTAWSRLSGVFDLTGGTQQAAQLDSSANERLWIWRVARRVIRDNPITGTGWGTFEYGHARTIARYRSEFGGFFEGRRWLRDAHSTPFSVLAETGIVGFLLWSGSIGAVLLYADRRRRRFAKIAPRFSRQIGMLMLGMAAYGVAAIWGSYQQISFLYIHLTVIWLSANMLERDYKAFAARGGIPPSRPRSTQPPSQVPAYQPPQVSSAPSAHPGT